MMASPLLILNLRTASCGLPPSRLRSLIFFTLIELNGKAASNNV
jgi:hypothetical protein